MKKTLAIILAMALLCIMAVGTTLSYFTDEDFDQNTMTVGKVGITQKVNGNENGVMSAPMFPVTAEPDDDGLVPEGNNGINLNVVVSLKNNSQSAYVRTVFAFEMMWNGTKWVNPLELNTEDYTPVHYVVNNGVTIDFPKDNNEYLVIYKNSNGEYSANATGATAAYVVGAYTYGELASNATASSLKQVYLDSEVGNDFSDAIGGEYEILVLSQAVQTQGFAGAGGKTAAEVALDTAFGAITAENATEIAKWFN